MTRSPDRPVIVHVDVTLEEFTARIGARLDAHFVRFAPVVAAINAGFASPRRAVTTNPSPDRGGKRTR